MQEIYAIATMQAGVVSWRQLLEAGVPRHRVRTWERRGTMSRVLRGIYFVPDMSPGGPDARRSRAAWAGVLATAPAGVASGMCALHLLGVHGLPLRLTPEAALRGDHYRPGVTGVRVRKVGEWFESQRLGPIRVATPISAMVHALPEMSASRAVSVLDSALNLSVLSAADLPRLRMLLYSRRQTAKLRGCWNLVDGRAGSPVETAVRLECVSAGVPPTDLQVQLTDSSGGFVARGDLGWQRPDGTWVLAEVDGRSIHSTPTALFHDRQRQNRILLHGRHTMLRFTARDLGSGTIPWQVREALQM